MASLLRISDDLLAFLDLVDEAGGELTKEADSVLAAWFGEINQNLHDKVDNYAALIRSVELRAAVRKEEMERLAKHVKADEALADRLRSRLKAFMEGARLPKVEARRYTVGIQRNGGHQPIDVQVPAAQLPTKYQRIKVEVDTETLRADLLANVKVDGAILVERGTHLRIR